ncbi:MAG TPA: asparagine synthase (glutamine-hydrolyzing) [Bacteroidia bacterium]|nr:asparagine synthase (glutamine-hydrolyzing) [Bacteroidia bacterium]
MCGIAGIYLSTATKPDSASLQKMNNSIAHRGPDAEGYYSGPHIGLAHRRLSIIDLSDAGTQPMHSGDNRYHIIFNGEIYNFEEVKSKLPSYPFKTKTDTEVILAAYIAWGKDCVHHFNGMFALAIWDSTEQSLFIVRDRLGVKPLYYHRNGEHFIFASETRALIASGMYKPVINKTHLHEYFLYQTVHAPNTLLQEVMMLMPGHYIFIKNGDIKIEAYWKTEKNISNLASSQTYDEVKQSVNKLLHDAVERRLVSDVPFGAFLSGGIDSSAVVGIMSKYLQQPVRTFNISFDESEFSEAKYAQIIAKKFSTQHTELKLSPQHFINDLPLALDAMDHPSGDGPNSYTVSKVTKAAGIKMALSGLGGDEMFAGYPVFNRTLKLQKNNLWWSVPALLRKLPASIVKNIKHDVPSQKLAALLAANEFNQAEFFALSRQLNVPVRIQSLLHTAAPEKDVVENLVSTYFNNANIPMLSRVSMAEINTYMQNVLLRDTDQMSMAVALEVRVPFLDYQLCEYVMGIPDKYKQPDYPKKLLVESLGDLLPPEIVHRKKMGFVFPWEHWLKNELRSFCDERIQSLANRSFMKGENLIEQWKKFLHNDNSIRWIDIWICVVLEHWIVKNNIDAR